MTLSNESSSLFPKQMPYFVIIFVFFHLLQTVSAVQVDHEEICNRKCTITLLVLFLPSLASIMQ